MKVNTVFDFAIPVCGLKASGLGPDTVASGPDDFLEARSLFLGPDVVSETGYAR
jgi:hypothetical protein